MRFQHLILSQEPKYRRQRELLFWSFYACYFYMQGAGPKVYEDIFRVSTYWNALLNLICFSPVSITIIWIFRTPVMKLILERKYIVFAGVFVLIFLAGTALNYFAAWLYLWIADYALAIPNEFYKRIEVASWNTRWAMTLGVIACGCQFALQWYRQTNRNLAIEKQNARAAALMQKSRIHPAWLFSSLDKIKKNLDDTNLPDTSDVVMNKNGIINPATTRSDRSAAMILHLADVLSYSLYESDADLVPLSRELEGLEQLVLLEQKNPAGAFTAELSIDGEIDGKYIAPMSVINRVINHITAIPQRVVRPCLLQLNCVVSADLLQVVSKTTCEDDTRTESMEWKLAGLTDANRVRELSLAGNIYESNFAG